MSENPWGIDNIPSLPKNKKLILALLGGGMAAAVSVMFLTLLIPNQRNTEIVLAQPSPEVTEPPPEQPGSDLLEPRNQAWVEVKEKCGILKEVYADLTSKITDSRAEKWRVEAKVKTDNDITAESAYDWLIDQGYYHGSQLEQISPADRLPTDAKSAKKYIEHASAVLQVAEALSNPASQASVGWVTASEFNRAVSDCLRASERYNTLVRDTQRDISWGE